MAFQKAQRRQAKLRIALSGTSGGGKTFSAIMLAKLFDPRVALMDSERGSALKYAANEGEEEAPGRWRFDHQNLEEKSVQEYLATIKEAAADGYPVLVIDSYSHSWLGALETVDRMGGSKFSNGWKVVSPMVTKLVDAILSYPGHVICTMRSKSEYTIQQISGKAVPKKVGMATVARDGTDYEFDVMFDMEPEGGVSITKSRCIAAPVGAYTREDLPKIAATLKAWLAAGAPLSPREEALERIRFASDDAALLAFATWMRDEAKAGRLSKADLDALKPAYAARKQALAEVAP